MGKDEDDDEPKTWVSTLKVVLAAAVLIGTIGLALWYADKLSLGSPALEQAIEATHQKNSSGSSSSGSGSWGISKDSPLRR
ncbi:MAG: hypothetical protein V4713_12630 [Pseudomonadota bacterium]